MARHTKKEGFTVPEVLVVICIIAILAAVAVVGYFSLTKKAKTSNAIAELAMIKAQIMAELSTGPKEDTINKVTYTLNTDGTITVSTCEDKATIDGKKLLSAFENLEKLTGTIEFNGGRADRLEPTCSAAVIISKIYYTLDGGCAVWNLLTGEIMAAEDETEEENPVHVHEYITHAAQTATCTEVGWEEYKTCSGCDYTTYKEIAALGHDLTAHEAKVPTCIEKGWQAYETCSRCGYTTYEEIGEPGHNYVAEVTAPTCTEQGYTTYTCSRCGDGYNGDYVAAPGHTKVTDIAVAAVCVKAGLTEGSHCSVCSAVIVEQEEIPALGHDVDDEEICKNCGLKFRGNGGTYSVSVGSNYTDITEVIVPSTYKDAPVTAIEEVAFWCCENLINVEIPDSVISIGANAFAGCSALTSIDIGSVTSLGDSAFDSCNSLKSVTLCNSLKYIYDNTFNGCAALESITIPDSVTSIGSNAFYNCTVLTNVTIGSGMTNIEKYAFHGCTSLANVYYCGTKTQWDSIQIDGNNDPLTSATRYYYSESEPTDTIYNYWHYADGEIVLWTRQS